MNRINYGTIYTDVDKKIIFWERKNIPIADDDVFYQIEAKYHLQPDLLAHDLYGTTKAEWIILLMNNIENPFVDFVAGKTIRLITPTRTKRFL